MVMLTGTFLFVQKQAIEAEARPSEELITIEPVSGLPILPHWLSQPYIRPAQALLGKAQTTKAKQQVVNQTADADPEVQVVPAASATVTTTLNASTDESEANTATMTKRTYSERTPEATVIELPKRIKITSESNILTN